MYADRKAWVASLRPGPIGYRRAEFLRGGVFVGRQAAPKFVAAQFAVAGVRSKDGRVNVGGVDEHGGLVYGLRGQ